MKRADRREERQKKHMRQAAPGDYLVRLRKVFSATSAAGRHIKSHSFCGSPMGLPSEDGTPPGAGAGTPSSGGGGSSGVRGGGVASVGTSGPGRGADSGPAPATAPVDGRTFMQSPPPA